MDGFMGRPRGELLVKPISSHIVCKPPILTDHLPGRRLARRLALDDERLVVLVGARLDLEEQLVRRRLFDDERRTLN